MCQVFQVVFAIPDYDKHMYIYDIFSFVLYGTCKLTFNLNCFYDCVANLVPGRSACYLFTSTPIKHMS